MSDPDPNPRLTRRGVIAGAAGISAAGLLPATAFARTISSNQPPKGDHPMSSSFIPTKDGVEIFYKDWGPKSAQPIMFHHGWPLSSEINRRR